MLVNKIKKQSTQIKVTKRANEVNTIKEMTANPSTSTRSRKTTIQLHDEFPKGKFFVLITTLSLY